MVMGGRNPEILITPIRQLEKIKAEINSIPIKGQSQMTRAIDIACMALKHREHKHARQRIIAMVASPLTETEADLINLGKKLRRNNVVIDVINLGEYGNKEKLQSFIDSAQNEDDCTFLPLDPGLQLLSDAVLSSKIMDKDGSGGANFNPGGFGQIGDMDDAELQMVLRMSAEEARQREDAGTKP